jgi:hypothetical protein
MTLGPNFSAHDRPRFSPSYYSVIYRPGKQFLFELAKLTKLHEIPGGMKKDVTHGKSTDGTDIRVCARTEENVCATPKFRSKVLCSRRL